MAKKIFCVVLVCFQILIISGCAKKQSNIVTKDESSVYNDTFIPSSSENQQNIVFPSRIYLGYAKTDQYVFFINGFRQIVRESIAGSNCSVLAQDYLVDMISCSGSFLYFHCAEDNYIYRMDFEGKRIEKIIKTKTSWFTLFNDVLYYVSGYGVITDVDEHSTEYIGEPSLYITDLNGWNEKLILKDVEVWTQGNKDFATCLVEISIGKNGIVYSKYDSTQEISLYFMDWSGNTEFIVKEEIINHFQIIDDTVFYVTIQNEIFSIDISGENRKKLLSDTNGDFLAVDSYLFFEANKGKGQRLFVLDLNTSTVEEIYNGGFSNPMIIGESLFYNDLAPVYETDLNTFNQKKHFYYEDQ